MGVPITTGAGGTYAGASTSTFAFSIHATVTTTASIDGTATVWPCDTSGGGFTITLPNATGATGRLVVVKKISSDANILTIATTGGQTIDGATTKGLNVQNSSLSFYSNGSNWAVW